MPKRSAPFFLPLLFSVALLFLSGCAAQTSYPPPAENPPPPGIAETAEDITQTEHDRLFIERYRFRHFIGHQLYWQEETKSLQFNFYFSDAAERIEIDLARQYVLESVYIGHRSIYEQSIYQEWLFPDRSTKRPLVNILCCIYIDEDLALADIYQNNVISQYENTDVVFAARAANEQNGLIQAAVKDVAGTKASIALQKSFFGSDWILHIATKKALREKQLNTLIDTLYSVLPDMADQEPDSDTGLVLVLAAQEQVYYRSRLSIP